MGHPDPTGGGEAGEAQQGQGAQQRAGGRQQGQRRAEGQQAGVTPCPSKAGGSLQPLQLFPPAATEDEQPSLTTTAQTLFLTRGKWLFPPEQHQFIGGKSTERGDAIPEQPCSHRGSSGSSLHPAPHCSSPGTAGTLAQLVPGLHTAFQQSAILLHTEISSEL